MRVSTSPGQMALTRTPQDSGDGNDAPLMRVYALSAAFETEYAGVGPKLETVRKPHAVIAQQHGMPLPRRRRKRFFQVGVQANELAIARGDVDYMTHRLRSMPGSAPSVIAMD